jgi:hypothetical protein
MSLTIEDKVWLLESQLHIAICKCGNTDSTSLEEEELEELKRQITYLKNQLPMKSEEG